MDLKNKRGEGITQMPVIFVGVMVAILIFFIAVAFTGPLKDIVDDARGPDKLNCMSDPDYNSSVTSEELTCVAVDLLIPGFIIIVILSGIAWITIKKVRVRKARPAEEYYYE